MTSTYEMELKNRELFKNVSHGKYYIEWENGADLSADTIEAHLQMVC